MLKNNKKAGDALIMLCYTCAFGAFGAFFRWLQMQVARDTETGLINPRILNILLPLLLVAAAVVLWLRSKKLTDDETVFPTGMSEALRGLSLLYIIFAWIIAALAVLGGILTIAETSLDNLRSMYVIIAALAMLSGLSFPLICSASRSHYSPSLVSVFMALPILMYCVWLIASYRANANNPNVWMFAIEIIAVCCAILALFYVAGYAFGRPDPKKACYMSLLGAFMCITTLADSRYMGLELIILATAGMLLMYSWLIIKNRCAKDELPPEPEKAAQPEPEEPDAADEAEDTVIEPTPDEVSPEPTIEAPTRGTKSPSADDEVEKILNEYKK